MNDPLMLILAALAGIVLGLLFFGGLWWTVRKGMTSSHPALLFVSSLILRMGIALVGIYYIGMGDWKRMVACVVGFIIARYVVTWWTRPSGAMEKEESHAS